ncbi:MAG: hypothetical protein ABI051_04920 [Vicinamibacterales bacterium]
MSQPTSPQPWPSGALGPSEIDTRRQRHIRRVERWLLLLALGTYFFTAGGSLTTTDAVVTYDVTEGLIERHSVAMSGNLLGLEAERGVDGRYYSPFGIGQSLYNVPFYLAGRAVANHTDFRTGKSDTIPKAVVALGQTLLCALIVLQTFRLSLQMTGGVAASLMAALTLAFASILWPYARFGFNQPLACATLLAAVAHAWHAARLDSARAAALAGLWLGAALLTRHEMILAALPIAVWLLYAPGGHPEGRLRRLSVFALTLSAGVAAWMTFNASRFGNPFDPGLLRDQTPGVGSSLIAGTLGLLFSPSSSILLYTPFVLAGVIGLARLLGRERSTALLLLSLPVVFLLFYATLDNWTGGRSYGSRYLLITLPYLAIGWAAWLAHLAAPARTASFVAIALLGITVQLPGVLVDYAKTSQAAAAARGAFTPTERKWSWEASGLLLNTKALMSAVPANVRYLTGRAPRPAIAPASSETDRGFSQQLSFSLDFWWLYLFYLRALSARTVALLGAGALVWIGVCCRQLLKALRHATDRPLTAPLRL